MKGILLLAVSAIVAAVVPPAAQVVFRSSVQYVTVDAVVTDKDDKPIENLGINDFEIEDNGKPQKVADFKFISIPVVTRTLGTTATVEPPPDVVSNLPATPESRLFAIVVDDLHLIEKDLIRIRVVMTEFLRSISPNDEVAMVFVSRSDMSVNFTRDVSRIMAPIEKLKGALGFGLDALARDPNGTPARYVKDYARSTSITLRNVVKSLAGSTHPRRAILFVSNGEGMDIFGLDGPPIQDMLIEYQDIFRDAARSDVPIYTICPRGSMMPDDAIRGPITTVFMRNAVVGKMRVMRNNLTVVANSTGGRAIVDASDMPRMINEVVRENGSYYLLGFYPDPFNADGKFHDLKVRVKREGARVRARTGYDAPRAARASEPVGATVGNAISAGVNVAGLPLRAFAHPIASDGKNLTVAVSVELTYPAPIDGSRRFDDNLQLKIVALDPDAKVKASVERAHHFTGAAPASGDVTFLINEVIQVPAQLLTLRIGVGSQALGKAGTVQVPIEMPKESKGLTIGGIAVGIDGEQRDAVMMANVFKDLIPFQPTTTRVFSVTDVLRLFGHVYWKDKSAQPVVAMKLMGPASATTVAPELILQKPAGDQQDAAITATLPMRGLAAGKYRLAISATLPGGKPVSRDVLFEIK